MTNKDIDIELETLEESIMHMNDSFKDLGKALNEARGRRDPLAMDIDKNGSVGPKEIVKTNLKRKSDASRKKRNDTEIQKRQLSIANRMNPSDVAIKINLDNTNDNLQSIRAQHSNDYHEYRSFKLNEDLSNVSTQQSRKNLDTSLEADIEALKAEKENIDSEREELQQEHDNKEKLSSSIAKKLKSSKYNKDAKETARKNDNAIEKYEKQSLNISDEILNKEAKLDELKRQAENQQSLTKDQQEESKLDNGEATNEETSLFKEDVSIDKLAFSGNTGLLLDIMINNIEIDDPYIMDIAQQLKDSAMIRNLLFKFNKEISKNSPNKDTVKYLKNKIRKEINNYLKTN